MTRAETAYRLRHDDGLTFEEIAEIMDCTVKGAKNHEKYWRKRSGYAAKSRQRYAEDPEYRAKKLAATSTPEAKARNRARKKERRRTDPEYRDRMNAHASKPEARERANKRRRERYAADKAYREKMRQRANRYRADNIDEVRKRAREYSKTPEHRANRKRWERENRDDILDKQRAYRAAHMEQARDARRAWTERNREHLREYRARPDVRAKALLAMSTWRYGPILAPIHRTLIDLKQTIKQHEEVSNEQG